MTLHDPWLLYIEVPLIIAVLYGYYAFVKEALKNGREQADNPRPETLPRKKAQS